VLEFSNLTLHNMEDMEAALPVIRKEVKILKQTFSTKGVAQLTLLNLVAKEKLSGLFKEHLLIQ
jgi:hypothetical protein